MMQQNRPGREGAAQRTSGRHLTPRRAGGADTAPTMGVTPADSPVGPIRVLLADDHEMVRKGIRMLLESDPALVVVGEARDGLEAVALAEALHPRVVLMDISMPRLNGIAATRRIRTLHPDIGVIALTMHDNDAYFFEILKAGGSGYLLKDSAPENLIQAIRTVAGGGAYLTSSVQRQLAADYLQRSASGQTREKLDGLTGREREILTLVAEGMTNQEIAEKLVLSVKTVETHRTNLMQKLDLHDRTELVKYAIRKGLISLEPDGES